ncbi:tryptophan halogenase family protein [Robiginitomaculum antarcticum]|uniref:tryptophan halogenase family protein n=1 Tax=Robiginitomaculum antarcticum TaxID=437507 RepID=UPI00037F92AC|nr:tryptophan halogenase family protein [Robiginitomaculum antarcticum]
MQNRLKNLVIVGGGTAGWMTAAALSSLLSPDDVSITLVESDQIGTVGVGEATIPDIINFNRLLGIPEAEFMKATEATFKLGIEFVDWGRKGQSYIHPFGDHGVDMNGIDFHQYWLQCHKNGLDNPIDDYSLCAVAARQNKFSLPDSNPKSVLSHIRYAYHFDATLYAKFLRKYAQTRGVKRIEGKVEAVSQDAQSGHIETLRLDNGTAVTGDFFFDCTGFRALLLGQKLGVGFMDWSHWLPCDAAQTVASAHNGPLKSYTRSTAKPAGWQWRIPTQRRTGNGHIYSRAYMSDDEAISILLDGLDGDALGDPRQIRFKTGCRETFWSKNCIALGLSSGFLEPLESTSIYLIQQGISRFISLFPDAGLPAAVSDEYNRLMREDFEQVRDFLILHYKATERDDSPFWSYCRTMDVPDTLKRKIELFKAAGRAFRYEDELFAKTSWVAVFLGQSIMPQSVDPIVAALPPQDVARSLDSMHMAMMRAAQNMPTHEEFIARYCAATID